MGSVRQGGGFSPYRRRLIAPIIFTSRQQPPSGLGCPGAPLAECPAVCLFTFQPPHSILPSCSHLGGMSNSGGSSLTPYAMVADHGPMGASSPVPGWREVNLPISGGPPASGLAPELGGLFALNLPAEVVQTMVEACAGLAYSRQWAVLPSWCGSQNLDPMLAPVGDVVFFLLMHLAQGHCVVTLRGMLAANYAARSCIAAFSQEDRTLMSLFMHGTCSLLSGPPCPCGPGVGSVWTQPPSIRTTGCSNPEVALPDNGICLVHWRVTCSPSVVTFLSSQTSICGRRLSSMICPLRDPGHSSLLTSLGGIYSRHLLCGALDKWVNVCKILQLRGGLCSLG